MFLAADGESGKRFGNRLADAKGRDHGIPGGKRAIKAPQPTNYPERQDQKTLVGFALRVGQKYGETQGGLGN